MGIIFRQSLKTSIVSYLGMAIGAFNVIWLYPKFLAPEEIGLMRVVQDIAIVFVGLTHIGTVSVTDWFFPRFRNHAQKHHGFLLLTLSISLVFFLGYCLIVFIFKDFILSFYEKNSPQVSAYFYYTIPLTGFMLFQLALEAYTRVHFRIVVSGFLRELCLRVMIGLLILIYGARYINFHQFMLGLVSAYGFIVIALIAYTVKLKILYLHIDLERINKKFLKDLVSFYLYVIIVGFHRMIISRIDILMIPALLSTRSVGIYSIALFIGAMIDLPSRAVNQISTPIISQAWIDNDIAKLQDIYQKSAVNQFILGGLLFLGVWCNTGNIFRLMPRGEIYASGKYVILLIGLARLIEMASGASDVIMLQSRYYRFNTVLVIALAILLFFTNFVLIPVYYIMGAALSTMISIFLYTLAKFIFLWIKFRLQPFTKRSLCIAFSLVGTLLLINIMPDAQSAFIDIITHSTLITIIFMSMIVGFRVSEELNLFIAQVIGKFSV
jgi:O-antigen/teichoic acid export membrane protein